MKELVERLDVVGKRLEELEPKAVNGTLTPEERAEVVTLSDEADQLEIQLRAIDKLKSRKADKAKAAAKATPEEKLSERFSLFKAVRSLVSNKDFSGAEAEVHAEGLKEARASQVAVEGFALPAFTNRHLQKRTTLDAATAATAANLIATELYDMVPALAPQLMLSMMGAQVWTGLVGDVDVPAGDGISTATFNTETGTLDETNPTTKLLSLRPKRLGAWTAMTLQMLNQSSIDLENYVITDLVGAEARKVEGVAILGGATNEPTGILGMSGTNTVAIGTNGGVITRAHLLAMESAIAIANADDQTMAFLTTPGVKGYLKNLLSAAAVGPFVWTDDNTIIGYNAYKSNLVPKTLVKGSSGANCHAVIFGDMSKLIIGNWGVRDLTVDNITLKKAGKIEVVMNSFWDVGAVHPAGFSVIKDALLA